MPLNHPHVTFGLIKPYHPPFACNTNVASMLHYIRFVFFRPMFFHAHNPLSINANHDFTASSYYVRFVLCPVNGTLFHRVIENFMIQGGDSTSRHAAFGEPAGGYAPDYTVPAEIVFPMYYHKRGALAAAREGDDVNPKWESSSAQFYIVYGKRMTDYQLDAVQAKLDLKTNGNVKLTPEQRETYFKKGGTPHLDGTYTVFGEVVEGMDVVEKIQKTPCDDNNRPFEDMKIIKAVVVK